MELIYLQKECLEEILKIKTMKEEKPKSEEVETTNTKIFAEKPPLANNISKVKWIKQMKKSVPDTNSVNHLRNEGIYWLYFNLSNFDISHNLCKFLII